MAEHWTNLQVIGFMNQESPFRIATLTCDIKGGFTRWKKGEVVKARFLRGGSYMIEKLKRKRHAFPLATQCVGIPRSALRFD